MLKVGGSPDYVIWQPYTEVFKRTHLKPMCSFVHSLIVSQVTCSAQASEEHLHPEGPGVTFEEGVEVCQVKRLEWGKGGHSTQWEQHMQNPGVGEGPSTSGKC